MNQLGTEAFITVIALSVASCVDGGKVFNFGGFLFEE